ncbi:uncharacterized protein [Oryctolagus cuniculus]|uniref:uncharacterized protein isoform X1 n=1 Tax=Oryctolagus cuniculus TaxID=9986 RepID=UPI003879DF4B
MAMAMAMEAGNAAYFQRGSVFWFAVLTLSFGYYTWLSSGRRASLMRALGSWARSLSPWWTIITPSCTTGTFDSQVHNCSITGIC